MRVLIQRVSQARVLVEDQLVGEIGLGLLLFLGVGHGDSEIQVKALAEKVVQLRLFDEDGKMNRSLLDVQGEALVISQFTLYADTKRGRRPNFTKAAPTPLAEPLYEQFKAALASYGLRVACGVFGAFMSVQSQNEGPVTIWLDSEE